MRIALATDWFAPRLGGIETQVEQLAMRLTQGGHEVDVLTTTPDATERDAFRVLRFDPVRLPGLDVALSPRLPAMVRGVLERGYDVVHCHVSVVSPLGYVAALVARRLALPVVVTFHSVLRHKRHLLRFARAAGLLDDRVSWTAVSDVVAGQARAALDAPVAVLPNGADLAFWRTASQRGRGAVRLVSAGRLERKKRPLRLARAFMAARRRARVHATLDLAGEGTARRSLELELRRVRDSTDVRLLGWQSREELRALYASADAFVMASEHESFGIAALEARAAGLPVIAMRSAGCSDFLTHERDALLAEDDDAFEANIVRFLSDAGLRSRLGAHDASLARYDWRAVTRSHEEVYARAITRAGSSPAAAPTA